MIIPLIEFSKVLFFNILLSLDNVCIVALSIKDLSKDLAIKVMLISLSVSAVLKILFSSILINILMLDWLPVRLIGGVALIKITWDILKSQSQSKKPTDKNIVPSSKSLLVVIGYTILADMSMSLENIVTISITSNGKILNIIFSIILSIPILIFGSNIIIRLMKKYNIIVYLGISALAYTAVALLLEDHLFVDFIPDIVSQCISVIIAISIIIYGLYKLKSISSEINTSE